MLEKDKLKDYIYSLMSGDLDESDGPLPGQELVENEFSPGKICDRLYDEIYESKCRLNERLGESENADIELIINNMSEIARILAFKMFDYALEEAKLAEICRDMI